MYLTDRLPKANYNEEGNDASHLSLPHIKQNATSPGLAYALSGARSGQTSISPLRGGKRKLGTRKKSTYSIKTKELSASPSSLSINKVNIAEKESA